MTDVRILTAVRWLHTAVYAVMVAAIGVVLCGGITGYAGVWLWTALGLLGGETLAFVGNGFSCPLTALAVRYGAEKGWAFDTFLPERMTRLTFRVFGSLVTLGLVLLALRAAGLVG